MLNNFEILSQNENSALIKALNEQSSNELLMQLIPQVKILSFQEKLPSINDTSSLKKSVNNEQHLTYHKKGIFIKSAQKKLLIVTLLTPFLMAAIVVIPTYLAMSTNEERHIAILDESNLLPTLETNDEITFFHYVSSDIETEKENLDTDEFYALIHIPSSQNLEELKIKSPFTQINK